MISIFPNLETKRLLLRQLENGDSKAIQFLRSDKTVNKFVKRPRTNTINEATAFINKINIGILENDWLFWSITIKEDPELIGTICIWNFSKDRKTAEIGYDLNPKYHRQGVMNEALSTVLNYGFQTLNLTTIEAFTHRNNESSKKLLIKNNFIHIPDRKDKNNLDNIIYAIHRNQHKL